MTSGVCQSVPSPEDADQCVGAPSTHVTTDSSSCVNQDQSIPPRPQPEDNGRSEGSRDCANSGGGDKGSNGARFNNHYLGNAMRSCQFLMNNMREKRAQFAQNF